MSVVALARDLLPFGTAIHVSIGSGNGRSKITERIRRLLLLAEAIESIEQWTLVFFLVLGCTVP